MWLRVKSSVRNCFNKISFCMTSKLSDPKFPPLLRGHAFDQEAGLIEAVLARAAAGELSAGDLVWSSATDRAECAIVLEPEISCAEALAMVPLAMVAVADSLGAIAPPNVAITFGWPEKLYANGAHVGHVAMHFPAKLRASDVPGFAVLTLCLQICWPHQPSQKQEEPGHNLAHTVLHEEGCGEIDRTLILESWSRHFLTWIDSWEQEGFKPVHENWLFRAKDRNQPVSIEVNEISHKGVLVGLDEHGGLLLKNEGSMHFIPLADVWFDPPLDEVIGE